MELPKFEIDVQTVVNLAIKQVLDDTTINDISIREWIEKIKSGEYAPVKCGHWIGDGCADMCCSECGCTPDHEQGMTPQATDYCPNCGAKMG